MADYKQFYDARDIIVDILKKDLVGPVREDEILEEAPMRYYVMGKLYPQKILDDDIDLAEADKNILSKDYMENSMGTFDESISQSNQRSPSSMGITCTVKPEIEVIKVEGSYAFYDAIPDSENNSDNENQERKWKNTQWKRIKRGINQEIPLSLKKGKIAEVKLDRNICLQVYMHSYSSTDGKVITVVLLNKNSVNMNASDSFKEESEKCAFQCEFKVKTCDIAAGFTEVNHAEYLTRDSELLNLELQYNDVHCYAQGHGCSADWDLDHVAPEWVGSSWFPSYNLLQMMPADYKDKKVLSMNFLAYADPQSVTASLLNFMNSYEDWICKTEKEINLLKVESQGIAKSNMMKCHAALDRIRHSIDLLCTDKAAMTAFQYANEAMLLQRIQFLKRDKKSPNKQINRDEITWYPFQLAFFLHEISSFIEPYGKERQIADLLWFPTGGGKTEAYLGISAFVIFLRRIRNREDDGVTVIMRYTLRLLTLQQFERASLMICACELLREKHHLGGSEISIGLWVGGSSTPNTLKDADDYLSGRDRGKTDPVQVKVCPWCGCGLEESSYKIDSQSGRMIISCKNEQCEFSNNKRKNGLPVHLIDESIYSHTPSFVVATVDKFAQIPLNDKPASLFGISNGKNPPELIIQDELHLISGPLGTMTGIYEAAITMLCKHNEGPGAKIIASTATIRNASHQILDLYGKNYTQFPPQGLTIKDSYFAVESTKEKKPARLYCGVMGVGVTNVTTLIRVCADLLYGSKVLEALHYPDEVIDNYWTITGYFNSLRELGGANVLILDDVQSRFSYLAKTKFKDVAFNSVIPCVDPAKKYSNTEELTSRKKNSDLSNILQKRLTRKYSSNEDPSKSVYDFVLASNMISVGVDIGRLGSMFVVGQPKTNAEFIQATSRVGRENPGLVVTVYNPSRSRDRSHYEQFLKYHSAMYRYVEATSLTPFADRARDRGLHALFVSLCRYLIPGMLGNKDASKFDINNPSFKAEVDSIKQKILDYVKIVDPGEINAVSEELDEIEQKWNDLAKDQKLVYKIRLPEGKHKSRLVSTDIHELLKPDTEDDRFRTMNSMRNVDQQIGVYLEK